MDTTKSSSENTFDENKSLQVIKEMIQVSQKKLKNDGILFIIWGWISFVNYFFCNYLPNFLITTHQMMQIVRFLRLALPIFGILFTLYYIFKQRKKVTTYIGITLRYVWGSLFFSMVLVNIIQFNILQKINFELQHPIFMVLIAFATVITGGILRFRLIIAGGVVFGALAYVSSYFALQEQLLIESIAWLIAFIIPGHVLYSRRKK